MKLLALTLLSSFVIGATARAANHFNGTFSCEGRIVTIKKGKLVGSDVSAFIQSPAPSHAKDGYNLYYFNSRDNEWEQIGTCFPLE